ncbi:MAG: hypothetical protein DRJ42_00165 [Deltaproteobacteria bacterium]|nr:MAG: hypothetical protein DRJ42_00165 [Deltaproteobacteria bacterium]
MPLRRLAPVALISLLALGLIACTALTREEAAQALEEAELSGQASALTSNSIELTTTFTIGAAVEVAAGELVTFYEAQLPCAEVALAGATLTITYGVTGMCEYRGQRFAGSHSVTIMANEMSQVIVSHSWDALTNGELSVTGTAMVTWNGADLTRRVVHETTWTRISDGRQGVGSGDRTQAGLGGDITQGFTVDGSRSWDGDAGLWVLGIDSVAWRWDDPVPESGRYTLETPFDKNLTLTFSREDDTTILVVAASGAKEYEIRVNKR